ncbi:MAG: FliI/YscN family ATPase [Myxococcota bacterium]
MSLARYANVATASLAPIVEGRLAEAVGLVVEAKGCRASIGDLYQLRSRFGDRVDAEVVGIRGDRTLLMPLAATDGLEAGAPLRRVGRAAYAKVGDALLGRVVDALGRPLDGGPSLVLDEERPLDGGRPSNPLGRRPVEEPFFVGVRAIDGLLTMGVGQRIGIFAGGGVGKSSLLGMMVRSARADVAVIALVGERGREVEEFVHRTLGEEGLKKAVVVAATSAESPLLRARGACYATAVAEHFRDRGKRVLLVMDSVTRYAMALREIGLAIGEPPTTKGYTPSVFAALPKLLERAGTSSGPGSITGVYTVLVEGDDLSDPISDAARAILDGHVVLSRELAERGHFPSIDANASVSRVMSQVTSQERRQLAQRARELIAAYREARDLQAIGAYQPGASPRLDEAMQRYPALVSFLRQGLDEVESPEGVHERLAGVWSK